MTAGPRRQSGFGDQRRSCAAMAAVMTAAMQELAEYGYAGMSAARIADRAGVNRTTVHRRWPNLEDLVIEALPGQCQRRHRDPGYRQRPRRPAAASSRDRGGTSTPNRRASMIRALVSDAARSAAIGDIVSPGLDDPLPPWRRGGHRPRHRSRGELRDDIPPGTLLSTFTGPLYGRLLITDEHIDAAFLEAVIDIGLDGARRSSSARESA